MKLAPNDHFVRYCKPSMCAEDGRILASAFDLRPAIESGLSGDHFEYFSAPAYPQIILALRRRRLMPAPNGKLAKINCGAAREKLQPFCRHLIHFERDDQSSHTELFGMFGAHAGISQLLCECVAEQMPIKNL